MNFLAAFFAPFCISLAITPLIKKFSIYAQILDFPNSRSMHKEPIARIGGLAVFLAFLLPFLYIIKDPRLYIIAFGGFIIALTGLIDDIKGISPLVKLIGQIIAGMAIIFGGIKIGILPDIISIPLTLFWMVGIMNAMNLLDGMDGLAAGYAAIASFFFFILAVRQGNAQTAIISLLLAGACLGFLKYNFHKASIFMGDTGSLFIGYVLGLLGVLTTVGENSFPFLFIPVIILAIPILDTSLAVIRRVILKKALFDADSDHFYEWLWKNNFLGYRAIVLLTYCAGVILGLIAILSNTLLRRL